MRYIKSIALCAVVALFAIFSSPQAPVAEAQVSSGTNPLSGWAWSSTIGWISFSSAGTGASVEYGVKRDNTSGELSGYAWANPKDDAGLGLITLDATSVFASIGKLFSPTKAEAQISVEQWIAYTFPGYGDYYIYLAKLPASSYTHEGKTLYVFNPEKIYRGGLTAFNADPSTVIKNELLVPVGYTRIPDTRYLFNSAQLASEPAGTRAALIDGFKGFVANRFVCTENKVNASQCHVNNLGVWSPGLGYAPTSDIYVSYSDGDSGIAYYPAQILGTYLVTTGSGSGPQAPSDPTPTPTPVSAPLTSVSTSNIGWITFNKAELTGCPSGECVAKIADGRLTGWARACTVFASGCSGALKSETQLGGWDGWISLSGTATDGSSYGPVVNEAKNGLLEGFSWGSAVIGWIKFDVLANLPGGTTPTDTGGGTGGPGNPTICSGVCLNPTPSAELSADIFANGTSGSLSVTTAVPVTISWESDGPSNRVCRVYNNTATGGLGSLISQSNIGSKSLGLLQVGQYSYQIRCEIYNLSLGAAVIAQGTPTQSIVDEVVVNVTQAPPPPASGCVINGVAVANGESRTLYKASVKATTALCQADENRRVYRCTDGNVTDQLGNPYDNAFTKNSCRAGTIIEQ